MCNHVLVTWNMEHSHYADISWYELGGRKGISSLKNVLQFLHESSFQIDSEEKENSFMLKQHSLAEVWKLSCQQANLSLLMPHSHLTPINLFHTMMHLCQTTEPFPPLPPIVSAGDGLVSLNTWMSPPQPLSFSYSRNPCSWRPSFNYMHLNSRILLICFFLYWFIFIWSCQNLQISKEIYKKGH